MLATLITGTVSSLVAIALVEAYLAFRKYASQWRLKAVLGLNGDGTLIVAPLKGQDLRIHAVSYRDAYAFGYIFELCHRVGVHPTLVPFHKIPDVGSDRDFVAVGGPLSNHFTEEYLARHLPAFRLVLGDANIPESEVAGLECGDKELRVTVSEDYGVLVKLTPEQLDQDQTVHLVFGCTGHGTAAAAYYLSRHYDRLWAAFGRRGYCVAIRCYRDRSFQSVPRTFIDLSREVGLSHSETKV